MTFKTQHNKSPAREDLRVTSDASSHAPAGDIELAKLYLELSDKLGEDVEPYYLQLAKATPDLAIESQERGQTIQVKPVDTAGDVPTPRFKQMIQDAVREALEPYEQKPATARSGRMAPLSTLLERYRDFTRRPRSLIIDDSQSIASKPPRAEPQDPTVIFEINPGKGESEVDATAVGKAVRAGYTVIVRSAKGRDQRPAAG